MDTVLEAADGDMVMRVDLPSGVNPAVWKRAAPRNRMRETFTSGSVGGLAGNSPILPGQPTCYPYDYSIVTEDGQLFDISSRHRVARTRLNSAFFRQMAGPSKISQLNSQLMPLERSHVTVTGNDADDLDAVFH